MNVKIASRAAVEELLKGKFPQNVAVISFFDPETSIKKSKNPPVEYSGKCQRVFKVGAPDIDLEVLRDYGLTYETFLPEADDLAQFIYAVFEDGFDLICQCEYGQSRSAACAAAILEHFYHTGIWVFADYRYYPNQVVFHKVYDALQKIKGEKS